MNPKTWMTGLAVIALMLCSAVGALAQTAPQSGAQPPMPSGSMSSMAMAPYFTAISYPAPQDSAMVMALSDFQSARSTNNFFTGMGMVQYGVTPRWTVGFMMEGQKILGLPVTYGGLRINSWVRVFPRDHLLNFTVYGEYEGLNGAALYKMEVAGFGGEDLDGPLALARRTPVRTFEQRAIVYHDWDRVNLTFNFINETGLTSGDNNFGYVWGVFRQPAYAAMDSGKGMPATPSMPATPGMPAMPGMPATPSPSAMPGTPSPSAPPALSFQRLGYGLEMFGALGNTHQFGFRPGLQQYLGPVFSYTVSKHWTIHLAPTFGLSHVSDPFVLRMGVGYSIDHFLHRRSPTP
jgi:hypothetical protein